MGFSPLCQQKRAVGLKVPLGNAALTKARKTCCGSPTRKLVYFCLCDHADDSDGHCWPSVKSICEETELSERIVRKCIGELEDMKLIRVERRGDKHLVSNYWIEGCTTCTHRVQQVQAKGAPRADKGAPHAPQASGSPIEAPKGNGAHRFPSELKDQIQSITEEIQRLTDFGRTPEEKAERLSLMARRKELKKKYFYA